MTAISWLRDPTRAPGYRWALLMGVMVCSWSITWYTYSIGVLLPYLRDSLHLRPVQEGWLGASFFLASFLLTIPLTSFFSRFRPAKMMAAILIASTALFFVAAAMPSYPAQLVIRFLVAALFVATFPARTTITQAWFRPNEYALANGAANSSFGIIEPLAFWFSAPLAASLGGWQGTYVFIGGLGVALTLAWVLFARDRRSPAPAQSAAERQPEPGSPLRVLRRREVWYAGFVAFGGAVTWSTYVTFWPSLAQDDLGLSQNMAGLIWGLSALGILPASLAAPLLLARLGRRMPIIAGASLLQLVIFPPLLMSSNIPFLTVASLVQGLSWLFFPLLLTVPFQMRGISAREIAVATGFIMVINRGGLAAGPAIAGGLAEVIPLRTAVAILSVGPLLSILAALRLGEAKPVGDEAAAARPEDRSAAVASG